MANVPTEQPSDQGGQITGHAEVLREQVLRAERQVAQRHSHAGGTHGGRSHGTVATHDNQCIAPGKRFIEPLLARARLGRQAAHLERSRFERSLDTHARGCGLPAT